jgi:regulatory protein
MAADETSEALEDALRALKRRDLSARELESRLEARGVDASDRASVLETLLRTGLLDDRRFAEGRAAALAQRGAGDALIRHALFGAGVERDVVEEAMEGLEPEVERARFLVARRGAGAKTARFLSGKGFSDEVVGAVAGGARDELG